MTTPPSGVILEDMIAPDHPQRLSRPRTALTLASIFGLLTSAFGTGLLYIADPDRFHSVPPGTFFVLGAAVVALCGERTWLPPVTAIVLATWLTVSAAVTPNVPAILAFHHGSVTGTAVTLLGIAATIASGVIAMVRRCPKSRHHATPPV